VKYAGRDRPRGGRLDLELTREQLSVNLSLWSEGRILLRQVEETRSLKATNGGVYVRSMPSNAPVGSRPQTGDLLAVLR